MRRDVYQEITDRVIAQLETVQPGDFTMPWVSTGAGMPRSIANRAYRGINVPLLMIEAAGRGFSSNTWGTYKAWQTADAQVRKGEKGTHVVFWKRTTYTEQGDDGEDTERQSLFAKMYTVFAGEQVDGYKGNARFAKVLNAVDIRVRPHPVTNRGGNPRKWPNSLEK